MVAYSFQARFLAAIRSGEKRQTIRLPRKRHARPGEVLQFLTGPRMKPTRVGYAMCRATKEVRLDFEANTITLDDAVLINDLTDLDAFAIRDGSCIPEALRTKGLSNWRYMARFWRQTHPDQPVFRGVLIDWDTSFQREPFI